MGHQITHKRLSNGRGHEHITLLAWRNDQSGETGSSSRQAMVDFVDRQPSGAVYTSSGSFRATVGVVRTANSPAYVRKYSDGRWTNNLLSLPDF